MRTFSLQKCLLLLAALGLAAVWPGAARAQVEVFGGYSYLRPAINLPGSTAHPNLNGWEVTGVYNAYHWVGIAADFSGHYGSVDGLNTHVNTYLFGPQIRLHAPISPFAHALVGVAHENLAGATDNGFAAAVGAGIDIGVAPFLSFRPIQLDYLVTRIGSSTQSQPRASVGLVLHF